MFSKQIFKKLSFNTNHHDLTLHRSCFSSIPETSACNQKTENVAQQTQKQKTISFTDSRIAYQSKTTTDLFRAYCVFRLCGISFLVDHQYKILKWTRKLIGRPLFRRLMKGTIYGQFMAGETQEPVLKVAKKHSQYNVQSMFNYTTLELHGYTIDSKSNIEEEELWTQNIKEINDCVDLTARSRDEKSKYPIMSFKVTSLTSEQVLRRMTNVINANTKLVDEARKAQATVVLDCLEHIADDASTFAQKAGLPIQSNNREITRWVSNLTNIAFHLSCMQNQKLQRLLQSFDITPAPPLSQKELDNFLTLFNWLSEAAQKAEVNGVRIAVDAEQSYVQPALDLTALDLMRKYNRTRPVIMNTYQCYLTRTYDILIRDLQIAEHEGFTHGSKVVRGGYMQEERRLAQDHGYPDPVNPTYDATTAMYYRVADELLDRIQDDVTGRQVQVLFATHNEDTCKHIVNRIHQRNMKVDGNTILFAQLVGMRDHITFSLGHAGIPAAKLLHYGPIDQGTAYLSRRVNENRGGIATADTERLMVWKELKRRLTTGQLRSPKPLDR